MMGSNPASAPGVKWSQPLPIVNRTWLPARRAEHRAVMHDEGLDDFGSAIDVHVRHATAPAHQVTAVEIQYPARAGLRRDRPDVLLRPLKSWKSQSYWRQTCSSASDNLPTPSVYGASSRLL